MNIDEAKDALDICRICDANKEGCHCYIRAAYEWTFARLERRENAIKGTTTDDILDHYFPCASCDGCEIEDASGDCLESDMFVSLQEKLFKLKEYEKRDTAKEAEEDKEDHYSICYCPVCHKSVTMHDIREINFCFNCGQRLRGDGDED